MGLQARRGRDLARVEHSVRPNSRGPSPSVVSEDANGVVVKCLEVFSGPGTDKIQ